MINQGGDPACLGNGLEQAIIRYWNGIGTGTGHGSQNGELLATRFHDGHLNLGVLQDSVAAGLEDQGPFKVDELDLLDALESAGLKLVPDDDGDVPAANAALVESRRDNPS